VNRFKKFRQLKVGDSFLYYVMCPGGKELFTKVDNSHAIRLSTGEIYFFSENNPVELE